VISQVLRLWVFHLSLSLFPSLFQLQAQIQAREELKKVGSDIPREASMSALHFTF
jgi:hypothetical protein